MGEGCSQALGATEAQHQGQGPQAMCALGRGWARVPVVGGTPQDSSLQADGTLHQPPLPLGERVSCRAVESRCWAMSHPLCLLHKHELGPSSAGKDGRRSPAPRDEFSEEKLRDKQTQLYTRCLGENQGCSGGWKGLGRGRAGLREVRG